jgi:hypothetical protein
VAVVRIVSSSLLNPFLPKGFAAVQRGRRHVLVLPIVSARRRLTQIRIMRAESDMLSVLKRTVDPNIQIGPDLTELRHNPAPLLLPPQDHLGVTGGSRSRRKDMRFYANATVATLLLLLAANLAPAADNAEKPKIDRYQDYYAGSGPSTDASNNGGTGAGCTTCANEAGCNVYTPCCVGCGWGIVAGIEATYLRPNIRNLGVIIEQDCDPLRSKDLASFSDLSGSPRVWLGVESPCGWGVRARYWQFNDTSSDDEQRVFIQQAIVDTLAAESTLRAYTVDVEGTKRFALGNWCVLTSFGVRNAEFKASHAFDLFSSEVIGGRSLMIDSITTENAREVQGTGLTSSMETVRPFGDHGLSLFWNLRGSVLWGTTRAMGSSRFTDPSVTALQLVAAGEDATSYIVETQLGVRWQHRLECLNTCAFAQIAFEYQKWTSDQHATAFDYNQSINDVSIFGRSLSTTLDFTGLAVAIGFTR